MIHILAEGFLQKTLFSAELKAQLSAIKTRVNNNKKGGERGAE